MNTNRFRKSPPETPPLPEPQVDIPAKEENVEATHDNTIHLAPEDTESYIKIPVSDMRKLFTTNNVLPVPVHGITISINLDEFQKISDANPDSLRTINALSVALEAELTVEEAIKIRDKQVFSFKTGSSIMEDVTAAIDTSSLTIVVPSFTTNLAIEDVSVEGFEYDDTTTLIEVKEEYREQTAGLSQILKKGTVVTILNMLQEEGFNKEFMFYSNLINKMPDSNSASLALMQMRLLMQYALNTDTVLLQSVMTDLLLNQGGQDNGQ